jgi:hypothetical protein
MSHTKEDVDKSQVSEAVSEIKRFIDRYERGNLAPEEAAFGTLVAGVQTDVAQGGPAGLNQKKDDPWLGDVPDANYPDANEGVRRLSVNGRARTA